jgi:hypothetical protein
MLHDLAKTREHSSFFGSSPGPAKHLSHTVPRLDSFGTLSVTRSSSFTDALGRHRHPAIGPSLSRLAALLTVQKGPGPSPRRISRHRALSGAHRAHSSAHRALRRSPSCLRTLTERPRTFTGTSGFHPSASALTGGSNPTHRASAHPHDLQPFGELRFSTGPALSPPGVPDAHRNLRVPHEPPRRLTKPLAPYVAASQR